MSTMSRSLRADFKIKRYGNLLRVLRKRNGAVPIDYDGVFSTELHMVFLNDFYL